MDNIYVVQETAKKFNTKLSLKAMTIFVPLAMLLFIISICFDFKLWSVLLLIIGMIILLISEVFYIGRKQRAVLYYDMNPQLYYAIIHAGDLIKIGTDPDIEIFYFAGDYQKAIDCADAMIDKFNARGKKYLNLNTLNLLACAYFEIGDYENAEKTIAYIKKLAEETKISGKKGYTQVVLPQLEFIESFIKCDFNKCLYLDNMLAAKLKKSNTFIARNKYYTALAKYYLGDMEGAKHCFEEILYFCPKLNYSNLAQQYLNAINSGKIMTLNKLNTDFKYDGNIVEPSVQQVKKSKNKRMICFIIAVVSFIVACFSLLMSGNDDQNMNDDYENSIRVVLDIQQE